MKEKTNEQRAKRKKKKDKVKVNVAQCKGAIWSFQVGLFSSQVSPKIGEIAFFVGARRKYLGSH